MFEMLQQGQKTLRIDRQHLKFPTFNLYTVPGKILYLQRYSTDFRKLSFQLEDVEGGHLGRKFQVRRYFTFAMARWKLCASTTFEISHFQPVHCASKNPISPKVFNRFSKTLLQFEDVEGGHLGRKVSGAQVFYFCNGKVKTLRIDNIWNFPLSTCTLCQLKSYISKGIQPIFENFASARRCWGWPFG